MQTLVKVGQADWNDAILSYEKHTIEDFKKFSFKCRDPKETNLAAKIDEILYGGKVQELSEEVLFVSFPPKN